MELLKTHLTRQILIETKQEKKKSQEHLLLISLKGKQVVRKPSHLNKHKSKSQNKSKPSLM